MKCITFMFLLACPNVQPMTYVNYQSVQLIKQMFPYSATVARGSDPDPAPPLNTVQTFSGIKQGACMEGHISTSVCKFKSAEP